MANKIFLGVDPMTGAVHYVTYDYSDDSFTCSSEVAVTALLERNQRLYNDAPARFGEIADVAGLPLLLQLKLEQEGIWSDPKAKAKWLNDIDHRKFRTRPGRV